MTAGTRYTLGSVVYYANYGLVCTHQCTCGGFRYSVGKADHQVTHDQS